jgi:hypothetical protein
MDAANHDVHFLQRLDRIALPEMERALSLYKDSDLVRRILAEARLAEGAERVAIALNGQPEPPHLVVARNGHFVTCLGAGMSIGILPVVSHVKLEAILARTQELRRRMEMAEQLAGPGGSSRQLFGRLFLAAHALSREEFVAISAWAPMLRRTFVEMLVSELERVEVTRHHLRGIRSPDQKNAARSLERFWQQIWSIAHLIVLCVMDEGRDIFAAMKGDRPQTLITSVMTLFGRSAPYLRCLWAAAYLGKMLLPGYRAQLTEDGQVLEPVLGLSVIGLRHARLRAQVQKILGNEEGALEPGMPRELLRRRFGGRMSLALQDWSRDLEGALQALLPPAQAAVMEFTRHLPAGSPHRFATAEEVPADLAHAFVAAMPGALNDAPERRPGDALAALPGYRTPRGALPAGCLPGRDRHEAARYRQRLRCPGAPAPGRPPQAGHGGSDAGA